MNSGQKVMQKRKLAVKKILIVLSVLICIAGVAFQSAYVDIAEIEKQTMQNLEDVAGQNAAILNFRINSQYQLLEALSRELQGVDKDTIGAKLEHFTIFLDEFELKRFAFCFPDGTAYSTDGEATDLSYRDFYKKGMNGECSITGILEDAIAAQHSPVNVMTIPVFDGSGEISGVFGLTYDSTVFNRSLQIDSFDGRGYSCILNADGEIMSVIGDTGLELSHNIMDEVLESDRENEALTGALQKMMERKEAGTGELYLPEKVYYYMTPVELMDGSVTWYMMTIIPAQVLDERVDPIQKNQYMAVFLVMLLVGIGAFVIFMYIRDQNKQLLSYAYEDPVTGGANYAKLYAEMEATDDHSGFLVAMDIANFNNISVVAGGNAADMMVKDAWTLVSGMLQRDELAAHVRDDEFLLFLKEDDEAAAAERMAKISEAISERATGLDVYGIQARYGICRMDEGETLESAYSKVKLAREYAVVRMESNYAFYNEVVRVKMQYEKQLEDNFEAALANEEFKVWYQPKYSAEKCTIVGSEALVRWQKDNGERISPGEFIPLFEHNGMIVKLDEYMFRSVCRQQKQWLSEGKRVFPVSINISRASLYRNDVHKRYRGILQEYGIEPQYIQLEVTETVVEEKTDIRTLLNKFREMGIRILMDDFGTGYSSLATLGLQCFDTLKLDKSLIDHIGSRDGETMLYHIIRMGQQMGLSITAEGVEVQEQLQYLQNLQCDDIQGFYFSRPLPVEEYEAILQQADQE